MEAAAKAKKEANALEKENAKRSAEEAVAKKIAAAAELAGANIKKSLDFYKTQLTDEEAKGTNASKALLYEFKNQIDAF